MWTHRWIKINKEGARNIFAIPGLCEEGFERSSFKSILGVWVGSAIVL
jgi:hypothetical protein